MKSSKVLEIVSFKGNGKGTDDQLAEKAQKFGEVLSQKFEGFINRKFGKENDVWLDIVEWESMDAIEKAKNKLYDHPESLAYFELCDEESINIQRIKLID